MLMIWNAHYHTPDIVEKYKCFDEQQYAKVFNQA